jgi:hypothetical protein
MKITIAQEVYEELLLNLIYTYRNTLEVKNKSTSIDTTKLTYEFIINSSLINHKVKSALRYHSYGNYEKAYDLLMYQCDISNDLTDQVAVYLLELEYLEFYSRFIYFYKVLTNKADSKLDKYRNLFINKRSKIVKFFNIDILKVVKRVDDIEFTDIAYEIAAEKSKVYMKIINHLMVFVG